MSPRRAAAGAVLLGAGLLLAGVAGLLSRHATPAMRPPPRGTDTVAAPVAARAAPSGRGPAEPSLAPLRASYAAPTEDSAALPVSLTIPVIGVKTRIITLGLEPDGTLQVPSSIFVAGWYTGSARPGAVGPAVIAGHIDGHVGSVATEGVFFRLDELRPGDRVYVTRADGTTAAFSVTSVQSAPKTDFPTGGVYGATADPELRLITCGGTFDYATGHYRSNTIVYAAEVS